MLSVSILREPGSEIALAAVEIDLYLRWTQLQERLREVQMRLHAGYAKPFQT
jgi:hypothetical protein